MTNLTPAQERIISIIKATGQFGALIAQLSNEEKNTVHAPATEAMARKGLVEIIDRGDSRIAILPGTSRKAPKAAQPAPTPKAEPKPVPKAPESKPAPKADLNWKRFPPQAAKAINRQIAKPVPPVAPAKLAPKAKMNNDKPNVIIPERKAGDLVALTGACYRASRNAGWPVERYDAILLQLDGLAELEDNLAVLRSFFNISFTK